MCEDDEEKDVSSYRMTLRKQGYWKLKQEALGSHSVEDSLCMGLWTYPKTDNI